MRSSSKKLSQVQINHFSVRILDITKYIRQGMNRKALVLIDTEYERAQTLPTGWRIKIQLLRRGIICLLRILKGYAKKQHENQNLLLLRLQLYIEGYAHILENNADQLVRFYSKELLLRFSQLQGLLIKLGWQSGDARCVLFWEPRIYYKDFRFHRELFAAHIEKANLHFSLKLLDQSLFHYEQALTECQEILTLLWGKNHDQSSNTRLHKVFHQIAVTFYLTSFVMELQGDYTKSLESIRIAIWFAGLIVSDELAKLLLDRQAYLIQNYLVMLLEVHEANKCLAQFFPNQGNITTVRDEDRTFWEQLNELFYEKYYKELQSALVAWGSIEEHPYVKKQLRLTEQETTLQTAIQTPRQNDKRQTFISTFNQKTLISLDDPRPSKQVTPRKHLPLPVEPKLTTDYGQLSRRLPLRELETFSTHGKKKDLDAFYEQKVLKSFSQSNHFASLKHMKQLVQGQEEINRVYQSDLLVGRKLLKFQKYTHQRVMTEENPCKLRSNLLREQEFLEGCHTARLIVDLNKEKRMHNDLRNQVSNLIHKRAVDDGMELNIKSVIGEYETTRDVSSQQEANSQVGRMLRRQHLNLFSSVNFRRVPETSKGRKTIVAQRNQ